MTPRRNPLSHLWERAGVRAKALAFHHEYRATGRALTLTLSHKWKRGQEI